MRSLLLFAFFAWTGVVLGQRGERDNTIRECFGKVADVFFILDSSSSIYVEDYRQVLKFVSQVATRFDVSRDDTRLGALTFSDDFQVGFDLDRSRTKGEVLASVNEQTLPYRTGVTNTDRAIRYVREDGLFRQDITKVMVVITDGGSRSPGATQREANLAREAGFHMVVVGVGQYLDEQEWRTIASNPDNDYVFNITNFSYLEFLRDTLPRRICLMPPIIIGGECSVQTEADLLFLSAPNGINDALDVIGELRDNFRSRERLNVAYIMQACQYETIDRGFNGTRQYCDRFGDALSRDETYVELVSELRRMATSMQEERRTNRQVAVLFVDDQSLREGRFEIVQEVRNAQQFDNINTIVVNLGTRGFDNFLRGMTSVRENIIQFQEDNMQRSAEEILERICEYVTFGFNGNIIPS